jgi:hypothetical protein
MEKVYLLALSNEKQYVVDQGDEERHDWIDHIPILTTEVGMSNPRYERHKGKPILIEKHNIWCVDCNSEQNILRHIAGYGWPLIFLDEWKNDTRVVRHVLIKDCSFEFVHQRLILDKDVFPKGIQSVKDHFYIGEHD